jgi:predicted phosphohydrolase
MVSPDIATKEICKTEKISLILSEITRLSALVTIASRFWVERLKKGEEYTEEKIKIFRASANKSNSNRPITAKMNERSFYLIFLFP